MSQDAPEPSSRWRYAIGADGALRRVESLEPPAEAPAPTLAHSPAGPPAHPQGRPLPPVGLPPRIRPPVHAPGRAAIWGAAIGGGLSVIALAVVAGALWLGGDIGGRPASGRATATARPSPGALAAGPKTATPVASANGTAGVAAAIDRQAFVRDFRTDFPDLARGRTDQDLLAGADALCVGLRKPLSWNDLVKQTQAKFGGGRRAASVLSLVSSQICPGTTP